MVWLQAFAIERHVRTSLLDALGHAASPKGHGMPWCSFL